MPTAWRSIGIIACTSPAGIQVFDSGGGYLGAIKVPEKPSNLAFSGRDKDLLYVTTTGPSLFRIQMLVRGPERLGK